MRSAILSLTFAGLLVPTVAQAGDAICEYSHPAHPEWDFVARCSTSEERSGDVVTVRAEVANGSRFTTERIGVVGAQRFRVNGKSARRLDRDPSDCYLTDSESETICIHPADSALPSVPMPDTGPVLGEIDAGFGGGQAGQCLLAAREAGVETLVEQGACERRETCAVSAETGAMGCLTEFDWKSGRLTRMARNADWRTLDGAPATPEEKGCFFDAGGGLVFCFSAGPMTAADYPVLAGE